MECFVLPTKSKAENSGFPVIYKTTEPDVFLLRYSLFWANAFPKKERKLVYRDVDIRAHNARTAKPVYRRERVNQSLNVIPFTYDYDAVWSFCTCWYKNVMYVRQTCFYVYILQLFANGLFGILFQLYIFMYVLPLPFKMIELEALPFPFLAHCNAYW